MNILNNSFLVSTSVVAISVFVTTWLHQYFRGNRKSKKIEEKSDHIEKTCSVCSGDKMYREHIVAGDYGSVCSECLKNSIDLIDNEYRSNNCLQMIDQIVIERLDRLDLENEQEIESPDDKLLEYILEKSIAHNIQRDLIISKSASLENYMLTIEVLAKVPENEWSEWYAVNWVWANSIAGDFERAREMPAIISKIEQDDDVLMPVRYDKQLMINNINLNIELDKSVDNIKMQLSTLQALKNQLDSNDYPLPEYSGGDLSLVLSNIAHCNFILGEYGEAMRCLDERSKFSEISGFTELLLGNIFEKQGELEQARTHWMQGLELAPRGIYHKRLQEKLSPS